MARKSRVRFELQIAYRHLSEIFQNFGTPPKGIHVILVPESSLSEIWVAAANAVVRDLEEAAMAGTTVGIESVVDPEREPDPFADYQNRFDIDVVGLRFSDGLDSGSDSARCAVYIGTNDGEDGHETLMLADTILRPELRPELVMLAATDCCRQIDLAEAEMLITMPYMRRRLALAVNRPIEESYELHLQVEKCVAEKLDTAEADGKTKPKKAKNRAVPKGMKLEELHGYGAAKEWGLELSHDISDAVAGVIDWADVDRGMLLSGAPGTGKTTFARALAATCGCHFVSGSYSQWQSAGHQGHMLAAMREAFEEARQHAPSILLIDEIDGFGDRDVDHHNKEYMRGVVNGLLELLDGSFERDGIVVLGATNHPENVDPAVRRAGRIDRHVEIGLPDAEARIAILKQHLGLPPEYDLRLLRTRTEGMSGADLERLARDARRLARRERVAVGHRHISASLPKRMARTPEEIRRTAVHEIGHSLVGVVTGRSLEMVYVLRDLDPADIIQPTGASVFDEVDSRAHTVDWYRGHIAAMMAGIAAEQIVYDDHGDGVASDLERATFAATYALATVGMGDNLMSDGIREPDQLAAARKVNPGLRAAVEAMLKEQLEHARQIIMEHRDVFDELVDLLVQHSRLHGSTVHEAVSRPRLALAQ